MEFSMSPSIGNASWPFLPTVQSNISNNDVSNSTQPPQVRNEQLVKIEVAVQGVILFLAIFGNGLVLFVLGIRRKKLSRMNLMIVHLSIADLFVAFFNVLPQLIWDITERFYGGDFLCRSVKYFQLVAMYASSFVLVSTAIDRWLVICHPLKSHTWSNKKLHGMVGIAWLLSLIFSIPQTIIFSLQETAENSGVYNCWGDFQPTWTLELYITWITVGIYIVPFLILSAAYGRICFVVWGSMQAKEPKKHKMPQPENGSLLTNSSGKKEKNGIVATSNPRAHVRGVSRAKVKTIKLTLTVMFCYLLCWGPFFVAQMWAAWDANAPFQGSAMVIIMLLASLNSCTNPWVYLAFSMDTCRQMTRRTGATSRLGTYTDSRFHSTAMSTTEVTRMDSTM